MSVKVIRSVVERIRNGTAFTTRQISHDETIYMDRAADEIERLERELAECQALPSSSGQDVLRVVEAAKELSASCDSGERYEDGRQRGVRMPDREHVQRLLDALAAMGRKG